MTKEMIISSNGHETMVAILEDDLVAEIFIERERQRGVAGNVYKGRVSKVLPGMQSSFIDLGLERDGFLYVADVIDTINRTIPPEGSTHTLISARAYLVALRSTLSSTRDTSPGDASTARGEGASIRTRGPPSSRPTASCTASTTSTGSAGACLPASERASARTVWPLRSSSATTAEPISPVPPVTKTCMELS